MLSIGTPRKYYLYRHTALDSGLVFYVGQGSFGKRAKNTYRAFDGDLRNVFWKRYVAKHGWGDTEIMGFFESREEVNAKEIEFIKLYGKIVDGGTLVNIDDGGNHQGELSNYRKSDKWRAAIKNRKGCGIKKGSKLSPSWKRNLSASKTGALNPRYGKQGFAAKQVQIGNRTFPSITDAAAHLGTSVTHLSAMLHGLHANWTGASFVDPNI